MFLKKLEISGFKSFANKSVLEFLPACDLGTGKNTCGITAIVGPNGSGKSNVADAIRWTMGEQSMKNLRGKKSEDVIFAGSGKKGKLGSAQVTLLFDNSDKRIPLEFSEVSITRKLFRSGESEYYINGSKTRLIDVFDLLAKAGVGKESYCVLNQGMSDAILNASPSERRMVLEDASGVKQYQIKKDRSIRKLDSTKNNLARVADLLREIEPHLKMLKRQAEKAQRGKEVADSLREKQLKLYSFLWTNFEKERDAVSGVKKDTGVLMMNAQREVDKLNDELRNESKNTENLKIQDELEGRREQLSREINNLERELVITEGRIEIEKEKQAQVEMIESIPVDLVFVKTKLERIRIDQEKLIKRIESAETMEELQEIKEFARAIQQELHDLYSNVGQGKVEVKKERPIDPEAEKRKKSLEEKSVLLKKQIEEKKTEVSGVEIAIIEEKEKNKQLRQRFFELEKTLHERQVELDRLKDNFNESKISLARVEVREEDLTNEIRNELKVEPSDLKYDGEECNRSTLESEIGRLKVQMEQIGGIDPMIVDEYEETNKRYEFLTRESQDLEKAIVSLREVIKEMDQKIGKTFEKAYEQINKEFTNYFKIIFGGGNASLAKIKVKSRRSRGKAEEGQEDAEEELETEKENQEENEEIGVDIFASPPGKKISNLSMLSGGERSLTSIALLFAIISYNPPPFAVLDEVEAALDEANSRRFGKILQQLSSNTQFIAITHNRETMRQASLLYGVTMSADGISKLLSIKIDQVGQSGEIRG